MAVKLTRSRRLRACPICATPNCTCVGDTPYTGKGERAIVMPIKIPGMMSGTSRKSGVVAKERIYENGRLLYAKGRPIKPEDVERLGYGPAPVEAVESTEAPKRTPKKTTVAPKAPKTKTTVARGRRARTPKPTGEDS